MPRLDVTDEASLAERPLARGGTLTIVGVGIEAVSQMSLGAIAQVRAADVVFYHLIDRVNLRFIRHLNTEIVDLYQFYGEEKIRRITYVQMSEVILRAVRAGRRVVAAFSGHPGIFTMASRRSVSLARKEGYQAQILPAISSIDCMIADLCIDPGIHGLQILKAGSVLRQRLQPATSTNVALLQIGSVGDPTYSVDGFKRNKRIELFNLIAALYGGDHEAVYYEASIEPGKCPTIQVSAVREYLDAELLAGLGSGILYLPPKGHCYESMINWDNFRNDEVEKLALEGLDGWDPNWESPRRPCSQRHLKAILQELDFYSSFPAPS